MMPHGKGLKSSSFQLPKEDNLKTYMTYNITRDFCYLIICPHVFKINSRVFKEFSIWLRRYSLQTILINHYLMDVSNLITIRSEFGDDDWTKLEQLMFEYI